MTEALTITTARRDDHQLDLAIALGPERTEEALKRAAKLVSRKARIPGFRPGKAPYATVLRLVGRDALLGEILDALGQEVYSEALEIEKLDPFGKAELMNVEMNPVVFKLVVPLSPTAELGDYRSLRVTAPEVAVTEADVDKFLDEQLEQRATWQAVERPAQIGDRAILDISGVVGEDKIIDNRDWEVTLREESAWLPGFDLAFIGMAAGDEKAFSLTYPEDSSSRYKGQTADFQATLKEVRTHTPPEITPELLGELGDYADPADLRSKKLEELKAEGARRAESELNEAAVQALVDHAILAYPPAAVDAMVESMLRDLRARIEGSGYNLEDFLRLQGTTLARYSEQIRPSAEQRLKGEMVIEKLAHDERIQVSPDETVAEMERMVAGAANEERARAIRELFGSEQGLHMLYHNLLDRKTLARLREIVTGVAPELPAEPETTEVASAVDIPETTAEAPQAPEEVPAPETAVASEADSASSETSPAPDSAG